MRRNHLQNSSASLARVAIVLTREAGGLPPTFSKLPQVLQDSVQILVEGLAELMLVVLNIAKV